MHIKDIFGDQIEVTDLNAMIEQYNILLGDAWKAHNQAGGYPNGGYITKGDKTVTVVASISHMVKELIKLLPPIVKPEWLLICGFVTCYSYCDTRKEVNNDYKTILRLFYSPLRIEITAHNKKHYPDVLELALQQLKRLQMRCNEPLVVTASGQTTKLTLSSGPDVISK